MSQLNQMPDQQRISDLKVSGHLMTLQTGLFCIFHTPGQPPPSAVGLPGVRISRSPLMQNRQMEIVTFENDGWIGAQTGAALVRVHEGPAQLMVTIYQEPDSLHEAPRLQVVQLSAQADAKATSTATVPEAMVQQQVAPVGATPKPEPKAPATVKGNPEIGAHIQRQGDVAVRVGEWLGKPGSHAWIEGFGISPTSLVAPEDIEYQAVLGKGWLSPWVEGGTYCGSRGMALPILGLCVRLKGKAAKQYMCRVHATFTDGTEIGPLETDEPIEAATLAPLEAFLLEIIPRHGSSGKKERRSTNTAERLAAEADLAALLEEEQQDFEDIIDDFALSIEEDDQEPELPVRRGKSKAAHATRSAEKPPAQQEKRGRKPNAVKAKPQHKVSKQPEVKEEAPLVRRGRGRPARRAVEPAAPHAAPSGRGTSAGRGVARRRKLTTRRS